MNWSMPGDGFPSGSVVKNLPVMQEIWVESLGQEVPLEKEMATHSSIAWEIPWTEEPGGAMRSQKNQTLLGSVFCSVDPNFRSIPWCFDYCLFVVGFPGGSVVKNLVKARKARCAQSMGSQEVRHDLATEQEQVTRKWFSHCWAVD